MSFIVKNLDFFLPILLLSFPFILKIMVDREVKVPNVIRAMCELPIDMVLLAISFLIALVLSKEESRNQAVLYFVTFFILSLIIVFISKRSIFYFEGGKYIWWLVLLVLNFAIALICLWGSVTFVIGKNDQTAKPVAATQISNHGNN